jgi:predicted amidohydrolase YtcJ
MRKLLAAALLAALPAAALADTLVHNINGVQVGPEGKLQRFRALVIDDAGKIRQTIERPELVRLANITAQVDGQGRTLLPGLIDAHGHVSGLGFAALQLDLSGVRSLSELQQQLRDYAAANPRLRWIQGRGWNQELWSDKRFPTAADIDAAVPDRPVWLVRVDGHAAVANSAAMRAAGVTGASAAPAGGRIDNGLFVDSAMPLVASAIPVPNPEDQDAALAKAQELMLAAGLTAVADMGTSPADWAAMTRSAQAGELHVRIMGYARGESARTEINAGRPTDWLFGDRLRLVGVKLYADGALGSRGAWLKAPYSDAPNSTGLAVTAPGLLRQQAEAAAAAGHQLAIHAIGDRANAEVLSIYERLSRRHGRDRRPRIEHFQVADPADIPRLAPAGIIASMQPTHQTSDRLMAEQRLGPGRLGGAYAWQSVLRSGTRLAFGSDFPVESPNPFPGLGAAISRQDANGQPLGGWLPGERLTFEQALHAFTRGAAHAGFAEDKIGSLEPGKWADFILVDRDVSSVDAQSLYRTQVLETWVAGKKVWEGSVSAAGERG